MKSRPGLERTECTRLPFPRQGQMWCYISGSDNTDRYRGKMVRVMGDKSPKNTRKSAKQKTDATTAKGEKKAAADAARIRPAAK